MGVKLMSYIKWGMTFESAEDCPDFGSINCTKRRDNNVNDYILRSTDLSKLSLITNAADGSTGLCIDTGDIYVLSLGEWVKFGGDENG